MTRPKEPLEHVPLDTSPQAHEMQTESYRRMGGKNRSAVMFRLNQLARDMAAAGIRTRHPGYTEEQVRFALFRLLLGDETAQKVWPDRELVDP